MRIYVLLFMPPKRIVEKILAAEPDLQPEERLGDVGYLVLYRFNKNPSQRYYDVRKQLGRYCSFKKLQRGVLEARNLKGAQTHVRLISHYDGQAWVFKAQKVEFVGV